MFLHLIFAFLFGVSNPSNGISSSDNKVTNLKFSQSSQPSTTISTENGNGTGGEVGQNPPPKID